MGKVAARRRCDKLQAPVKPAPALPYACKDNELARMQKAFAAAVHIAEVSGTSFNYKRIKRNVYVACKRPSTARAAFCTCSCDRGAGCTGKCELRRVHLECHRSCGAHVCRPAATDRAGPGLGSRQPEMHTDCGNQRLQRLQYARTAIYPAGKKGYGLFALSLIKRGTLVTEYVGEVITREECMRRKRSTDGHLYFLALDRGLYIDAAHKGNESRFINHSCEPNCEVQLWYVGEEPRAAVVAKRDINPHEELNFDYKFDATIGVEPQYPCFCGAPACRGHIDAHRP